MDATSVGLIAGFLTTLAFVPQVLKIYRSKSADDVSLLAFSAFTVGVALWILYGVMQAEIAIVLWNTITLGLAAAILAMKVKYR